TIEETADLTYFFGEGAEAVHANQVFYPDKSIIDRCALMHDCADNTQAMLDMWNHVKGDSLNSTMIVIIAVLLACVIIFAVIQTINKRRQRALQNKHRKHNR
ncbi:MAG: hypothetical protein KBS40_05305, partial [Bacteroidales bacterium]|nr:hypothetical protein [Bacteroidales bacterium]